MNIRTILVPVDFSGYSLQIVRQVAGLAAKLDARLVLLHVAELPAGVPSGAPVWPDGVEVPASAYLIDDSRARLASFADAVRELGAAAEVVVEVGPVVPTILTAVDQARADLVVMGTHGRTGLTRMVLGSVAEGVAHRAHVPVMLVRRECGEEGRSPAEERLIAETQG